MLGFAILRSLKLKLPAPKKSFSRKESCVPCRLLWHPHLPNEQAGGCMAAKGDECSIIVSDTAFADVSLRAPVYSKFRIVQLIKVGASKLCCSIEG